MTSLRVRNGLLRSAIAFLAGAALSGFVPPPSLAQAARQCGAVTITHLGSLRIEVVRGDTSCTVARTVMSTLYRGKRGRPRCYHNASSCRNGRPTSKANTYWIVDGWKCSVAAGGGGCTHSGERIAGHFAGSTTQGQEMTYQGSSASTGQDVNGDPVTLTSNVITLKISSDSQSVTVHFDTVTPILYCMTQQTVQAQSTTPAKITDGSFEAEVAERFVNSTGPPPMLQIIAGHFSGDTVSGTIRTEAAECSGTTTFSATAQ